MDRRRKSDGQPLDRLTRSRAEFLLAETLRNNYSYDLTDSFIKLDNRIRVNQSSVIKLSRSFNLFVTYFWKSKLT